MHSITSGKFSLRIAMTSLSVLAITACSEPEVVQKSEVIRPVKLHTVSDNTDRYLRSFPAIVASNQEAQLSFRITGELASFPVTPGSIVKAGDLLGKLDDRDITNELKARQADFDLAKVAFDRVALLRSKNLASPSDFDTAETRLKAAQVSLQTIKDRLTDTVLKAPFSGRIAKTLVENHQSVEAQQTVAILQDNRQLEIKIQLPESVLSQVKEDQIDDNYHPFVTFPNHNGIKHSVEYKEHTTKVSPGTQTYEVTFSMPAPANYTIYPGMTGTLTLDMRELTGQKKTSPDFVLPLTAVQKDINSGEQSVWVYQPETQLLQVRSVQIGEITQNGITVVSGLQQGEQVVSAGLSQLSNGMKVKPLQRERGL